jgi:cytoskeleton protein RodZ
MEKKTGAETSIFDLTAAGPFLREAREAKGLSIEDVSKALFLRKSLIGALETGTWENLPHPVYVKGYLTQYASYLKVQHEVLSLLKAAQEKKVDNAEGTGEVPVVEVREAERPKNVRRLGLTRAIAYAMIAAFLVGFFVIKNMERPVSVKPTYENVSKRSYEPEAPQRGNIILEQKKLMIACHERTWVRIVIDETEKKEFMLNPQEMVVFTGKDGFDLLIGNAGGVKLYYNGSETDFSGESGQVKRVRLP